MDRFGARLREARRWAGLTQKALAEGVKVHRDTIRRWERNGDVPSFHMGCRIARYLGVSSFFLAGMTDNPRLGIQFDNEDEIANAKAYKQLSADEKKLLVEMVSDFLKMRRMGRESSKV